MSNDPLPRHQRINDVSARDGALAFAGDNLGSINFLGTHDISQRTFEENVTTCLKALFLTDCEVDREQLRSTKGTRVRGTCEWIRDHEAYQSWLRGDVRLLWISGGPGKGKTMMSIFLTEDLQREESSDLLFYFCSHQSEQRNSATAVLRGLLHQIVTKRTKLGKYLLPCFETPERIGQTLSSPEALWMIFQKMLQDVDFGTMSCVLDGLDECDDSTLSILVPKIISMFDPEALQPTTQALKLIIVSRDITALQGMMLPSQSELDTDEPNCCAHVKLDPDNDNRVASDLDLFISARMRKLSRIEGFNQALRTVIHQTLSERSEGTFLWVGFVMIELSQKRTCTEVLDTLNQIPKGLPAIYGRMLLQIECSQRGISSKILRWITMATRRLSLQELAVAIGLQPPHLITTEQAMRDQIALCGPFLKVQPRRIGLVHQSARDYLLREDPDCDAVLEEFRIKPEEAHLELARTCLDYVEDSGFRHSTPKYLTRSSEICFGPCENDFCSSSELSQESPLLDYATFYWPEHARCCSTLAEKLFDLQMPFFRESSWLRTNWFATYGGYRFNDQSPISLLHVICYLGIVPWVQELLRESASTSGVHELPINDQCWGDTPLTIAAREGHETVIRLLIKRGADVNALTRDTTTALHWAARAGHEAVVRLLLEHGADVGSYGQTELQTAAEKGHEAVVRLLLEHGADVNAAGWGGVSALATAASGGYEAVVRLLLEHGADVNAAGWGGVSALATAALGGYEAVVRLLLEHGADVNKVGRRGVTALENAASGGYEAVVRLLLELGADVNALTWNNHTVLYWAAREGYEAVVRLLLEHGADVNAAGWGGQTALQTAAERGHEAVVRLLIERGAEETRDVNRDLKRQRCKLRSIERVRQWLGC